MEAWTLDCSQQLLTQLNNHRVVLAQAMANTLEEHQTRNLWSLYDKWLEAGAGVLSVSIQECNWTLITNVAQLDTTLVVYKAANVQHSSNAGDTSDMTARRQHRSSS